MNANFDKIQSLYSTLNIAINQICPQSFFLKPRFMLIKTTSIIINQAFFILRLATAVDTKPENNDSVVVLFGSYSDEY